MSLLLDEQPSVIQKGLASVIGLNESIVVQQIHYWTILNKKSRKNYRNGFYWTYNSFENWNKEFPFWSLRTIKRIFTKLENKGIIITDNFNKIGFDRTKWYRIDYDVLKSLFTLCQFGTMDSDNLTLPIPETNTETNNNGTNVQNNGISKKEIPHILSENDEIKQFIEIYMNNLYKQKTGNKHQWLKSEQYNRVHEELTYFINSNDLVYEDLIEIAIAYLNSDIQTDYNINHFANYEILKHKAYEIGLCPYEQYGT